MLSNKKNILFISTIVNYFIDGHASFNRMYKILDFFHKHKNFNVVVLLPDREQKQEKKKFKKNIKVYHYKEISILRNNLILFNDINPFFFLKVFEIIKKHRIDLIHVDYVYGINCLRLITNVPVSYNSYNIEYTFANEVGKFFSKIPIFLRPFYSKFIYFLEKYAIKFVKNVNAISYNDKKKFIEIYNTPADKIFISRYGYDKIIFNNPIEKKYARKKLNVDKNKFIIIFHGSYYFNDANKEAIHIIKDKIAPRIKDKDILFLIAGNMLHFKDKSNLKFLGFVKDLKEFLYSADLAIVPIYRGSGVKTKIFDYLSALIPVITTNKGAEGILLKNGVHGYIVNSVKEIINKILELKDNPKRLIEFKKNIRELILKNYDWDNNLEKLEKRYYHILS